MRQWHVILAVAACLCSCGRDDRVVASGHVLTEPTQLCREGAPPLVSCREAEDVEALLERSDLEILAASGTSTGVQGAHILTLRTRGPMPIVFRAKWRPESSATRRNSPRLELAAYAVQKLFLEPREYVVPPTVPRCFPLAAYRARVDAKAQPTFPDARCVYGFLSYWLEDVSSVADAQRDGWFHGHHDHIFDPELFERDGLYRDAIGRLNVLTYVIGHRDSHARNFVLARSRNGSPFIYSVDNSLSFTMAPNPRIARQHDWSKIRVPALPRTVLDRLRSGAKRVSSLATIATVPGTNGRVVGLTAAEIEGVRERMTKLSGPPR